MVQLPSKTSRGKDFSSTCSSSCGAPIQLSIGQEGDDERPINGHTAAHPATASELCINGYVTCGRKITWGPGLRACKVPMIGDGMALLPPGIPHAAVPWR